VIDVLALAGHVQAVEVAFGATGEAHVEVGTAELGTEAEHLRAVPGIAPGVGAYATDVERALVLVLQAHVVDARAGLEAQVGAGVGEVAAALRGDVGLDQRRLAVRPGDDDVAQVLT
jgi:hypothetical protein